MNHRKKVLALWLGAAVLLLAGAVLTGSPAGRRAYRRPCGTRCSTAPTGSAFWG